jgi:hypothetical protein
MTIPCMIHKELTESRSNLFEDNNLKCAKRDRRNPINALGR